MGTSEYADNRESRSHDKVLQDVQQGRFEHPAKTFGGIRTETPAGRTSGGIPRSANRRCRE